jgi:protein AroM
MKTVAAITIGQTPRDEVIADLSALAPGARWLQAGALDGLDADAVQRLEPDAGDVPLVARLRDGRVVKVGERALHPRIQDAIARVEPDADLVLILCAGRFSLASRVPIVYPSTLVEATVQALRLDPIAVLTPHEGQVAVQHDRWAGLGVRAQVMVAPPYGDTDFARLARAARAGGAQAVVLDCLGYTQAVKRAVADAGGLPTILIRSLAARVVAELLDCRDIFQGRSRDG